jgi:ABC-type lipoprotein release transport system permease subunit
LGDVIRARFQDINGQNQAARLSVVGIFNPANVFMNAPIFMDIGDLKRIAGYGPGEIGSLFIMLRNPKKTAIQAADRLHAALQPPLAAVSGSLNWKGRSVVASVLGFRADSTSLSGLGKILPGFGPGRALKNQDVLLGQVLADSLRLRAGDRCTLGYVSKRNGENVRANLTITAVIPESPNFPAGTILVNDRDFYGFYYKDWPKDSVAAAFFPDIRHPIYPYLGREWILLDRTRTTQEFQRKFKLLPRLNSHAVAVDVATMYETASMVVNLENALNLITLIAVLILFFIIQVGVVNTLRMTIIERTREIGTMRSIGMQKADVRNLFLLETFFLSLFACAVGVGLSFAGMWALRRMTFETGTNPITMLLVDHRLHFMPTATAIGAYFLLILFLAVLTAWFPARRAARLAPSDALRHFG